MSGYYVMRPDYSNVGGFSRVRMERTMRDAEKLARAVNGIVWTERDYNEWHEANIMPYYRERGTK